MSSDPPPIKLHELIAKWTEETRVRCEGCRLNWDLGAHGCHFEPVPTGEVADEYGGVTINCQAYGLRKRIKELEAALAASEPGQVDNCKEYALGHKDGVAWCRKALNKAIEERGREFAVDFLDEYLAFPALAQPATTKPDERNTGDPYPDKSVPSPYADKRTAPAKPDRKQASRETLEGLIDVYSAMYNSGTKAIAFPLLLEDLRNLVGQ